MSIKQKRPAFPARAVVTAGMPYGNKELHFGHVGGLFIHADTYARFLRDRIGKDNVIFVSGTDCYGATSEFSYENAKKSGEFEGTLLEFVEGNHIKQKEVLAAYGICLDLFAASALGEAGKIHTAYSREVFERLYAGGFLSLTETMQFYDEEAQAFLNGRQVNGRCPIQGCKSELAYADECSLGHQYSPEELIAPVSVLSGKRPTLKPIRNWCFDLERFGPELRARQDILEGDPTTRKYLISVIEEFLRPPMVYVKKEQMELVHSHAAEMPPYETLSEEQKTSDSLVFGTLADRAAACRVLDKYLVRYRTGKTLVPFRISGNVPFGVPVPEKDGAEGLTFWVWPESLWAPISFTKTVLAARGAEEGAWQRWWNDDDAKVYQFIGEDNIYFYSVAQTGLFLALGNLKLTTVVPNRHVLYMNKKASSSSAQKPPKAAELLERYTKDQLRMHFFHLNLGQNSVSFSPKAFTDPENTREYDPVLYEGNILTNIYNRLIRSCFYSVQKYFDGILPEGECSQTALEAAETVILEYERAMYQFEFGRAIDLIDGYLREANKIWAAETKKPEVMDDAKALSALLRDSFHAVRVAAALLHPMAPEGVQMVGEYLGVGEALWDWQRIFEPLSALYEEPGAHRMKFLEPRVDFFKKHGGQLAGNE